MEWAINMKVYGSKIIAITVIVILIISGSLIILPRLLDTLDNVPADSETYFPPDPRSSRPTRAGTPWPMHLNNPVHTSFTTDAGPTTNNMLWFNSTGGVTYGSPAVVNDKVFIGGGNGMNCFYANNGTLAWRTPTHDPVPGGSGLSSSPAMDNGFVFFGGDGLYCLYENNGSEKWFIDTPWQNWGDGTPTVANGMVYIGGSDRKLYAIEQDSGNVLWTFQTSSSGSANYGLYAAPAITNGYVYLAACDGFVYKINETQPTPIATAEYSFDTGRPIYSSPVVVNGRVYFGNGYYDGNNANNRFYCLDATDLAFIWAFYPGFDTSFFCSAGYYNDKIYVGSRTGYLYCLNATGGGGTTTVHWGYNIGNTWSSPALTNDRLYIGSKAGSLYCFNLSQTPGSEEFYWRYDTGGNVDSSPAVTGGKVYVGSRTSPEEGIYCFGTAVPPTIDRIEIRTQADGGGSVIPDFQDVDVGTTITGYTAAYNGTDYLYDIPVNWSVINDPFTNATTNPTMSVTSSNFYSGYYGGTVTWTAEDGNGHSDSVVFTINPPQVDYIRIVDNEGTGTAEISDKTVDVGYSIQGHAAGYNNTIKYIGDVSVTWSVINSSGAQGTTTPTSGPNSTLNVGLKGGNMEWIANDGFDHIDSVNFTVREPTVNYIVIMTGPNGTGSWVGDSTFVYANSTKFYAGGYNDTAGWVKDVPALWSSNNSLIGDVDSGPSNSTTFVALNNGTCNVTAEYGIFSNSTGVLTIINYTIDYIIIRDAPNNGGTWVGDRTFSIGDTATFHAAAYNYSVPGDGYIGDVSAEWESSDNLVATVTSPGTPTLFTAQFISGECNVTARYGPFTSNVTGKLTVLPPEVDYIIITNAPNGLALTNVNLDVGQEITIFASGYNETGVYVGPVEVEWTQSPSIIGSFSQSSASSTTFTAGMSEGGTTITGSNTLLGLSDDFTIIVNKPTVDYIQIRDTAGGLGSIVTTGTYVVYEVDLFYAAAYNNTADYLYDVAVMWLSNDTDVGKVNSSGIWTNFTARQVNIDGTCFVTATFQGTIANETGPLMVLAPTVDYIQIRDAPGGEGNVSTTAIFTLGEVVTDTYYCAAYNHTAGYIGDRSVQWAVTEGIGTISPNVGSSTNFTATNAGTGVIRANLTGITNSTGTITVNPAEPSDTPPSTPGNMTVTAISSNEIKIEWSPNSEPDLAGYIIQRSTSPNGPWDNVTTVGRDRTSYTDTGLESGTTYYYRIIAIDNALNESPPTPALSATTSEPEEFSWLWILIIIVIIIVLILIFAIFKRRKKPEEVSPPPIEKRDVPLPPPWMKQKEESPLTGEEEALPPQEDEIPEEELPPPDDEEIPENELPPPDDEEEPPPPDDEEI